MRGDNPDRDYFNVGVGILMVLPNGWMPFVDYESLISYEDLKSHKFVGVLRVEFCPKCLSRLWS